MKKLLILLLMAMFICSCSGNVPKISENQTTEEVTKTLSSYYFPEDFCLHIDDSTNDYLLPDFCQALYGFDEDSILDNKSKTIFRLTTINNFSSNRSPLVIRIEYDQSKDKGTATAKSSASTFRYAEQENGFYGTKITGEKKVKKNKTLNKQQLVQLEKVLAQIDFKNISPYITSDGDDGAYYLFECSNYGDYNYIARWSGTEEQEIFDLFYDLCEDLIITEIEEN